MNKLGDDRFSSLLRTPYAHLGTPSATNKPQRRLELDQRIEEESKLILNTFNATLSSVFAPEMTGDSLCRTGTIGLKAAKGAKYDFSILVSMLARIWEIELNKSLVPYILCHQESAGETNADEKGDNGALMFSGIIALLGRNKHWLVANAGFDTTLLNEWLKLLDKMRDDRNHSSHTDITDEASFVDFYERFCRLVESDNFFSRIMDIKQHLLALPSKTIATL